MRKSGRSRARLSVALAAMLAVSAMPVAAAATAPESPGTALSRHIRVLAKSPRDFNALIGAGRAALELGDIQSAAGFFGRAEEVNPNAAAAKAGLGAAMAHMGDADGAIFYFNQAIRLGAPALTIALDRGLARDLLGDLGGAQSDYRTAIQSLNSDEARRRLALSLAIARDRNGALAAIQPLLNRRDPAAQRTRAFVLALVGDQAGAAQAIEAVMPGGSARFSPFFTYLPHLSIPEKAAAVHLGIFPDKPEERVAQAQAAQRNAQQSAARANQPVLSLGGPALGRGTRDAPDRASERKVAEARPAAPATPPASFTLPSASSAKPAAQDRPAQTVASAEPVEAPGGNLTGIDRLLATIAEPPPPPQPKVEQTKPAPNAKSDRAAKAAAAKKAAEEKARQEKLAAEKKEREEAAKLGVKGTYWVQLAGGSNRERMAAEYKRVSGKAGKLLKSRPAYVTEGKEYFRLLVGPFDDKPEAQSFVNKLAKEGVDGFSWTRTPPKIRIEKLASP